MNQTKIPPSPSRADYTQSADYQAVQKANAEPIFERTEPFALFDQWMREARAHEISDSNAMSLASVDGSGMPDVRMVLLKQVDEDGFVFYSHANSAKGQQLKTHAKAAINFHWKSLRRQVRVRGQIIEVPSSMVEAYFSSRARDAQIGAWASKQSHPMAERAEFEAALSKYTKQFEGKPVPVPPGWTGWRIVPQSIEFWRDRPFRLHDRLLFTKLGSDQASKWTTQRLYP